MDEKNNKRLGELLILLAGGTKDALIEIYEIMSKILYSVGNAYFLQEADIKDVIQDLMEKLIKNAKKFKNDEGSSASAWILTMYRNIINNNLKRMKRENDYVTAQTERYKLTLYDADEKYIENYVFINQIFINLSEYEKDLFIYRYWCKCTLNEMSQILKKPLTTIESQLEGLKYKISAN